MPQISVIIPNYNHSKYLIQRINSILNQSFQDFELIILDDCSTDNSCEIIEQYHSHPKISQIIYNKKNSGSTFKQWNKGIRVAKGDLIWLAESDDDASEHFLEEMVSKFKQDDRLGIVYCDSYYINEKNEKLKRTSSWKNEKFASTRWLTDFTNTGVDEVNNYLIYHNVIDNASSALFKKETLIKAGLADENFKYVGDLLLYMKVLMLADVAYVSRPLNYFRDHPANTSKESFTNGLRSLEGLLSYTEMLVNNKISDLTRKKRYNQALTEYRYFLYINLKGNRNLPLLLKGHLRLLKSNLLYSLSLFSGAFKLKLTRLLKL